MKEEKTQLFGFPCDICQRVVCATCSKVSASEVRVLILKARSLQHFCPDCIQSTFRNIAEMSQRLSNCEKEIKRYRAKVDDMSKLIKSTEEELKILRVERSDSNITDLNNRMKTIEEKIKLDPVTACDDHTRLEQSITKSITEALQQHTSAMSANFGTLMDHINQQSSDFRKFQKSIDKLKFPDETDSHSSLVNHLPRAPSVSTQRVSHAVMQATTQQTLSKYINLAQDINEKDSHTPNKSAKLKNRISIIGEKKSDNVPGNLKASTPLTTISVSKVSLDVTGTDLLEYLRASFGQNVKFNIENTDVKSGEYKAFKVMAPKELEENLLQPNNWPQGIAVKKFTLFHAHNQRSGHSTYNQRKHFSGGARRNEYYK